MQKYKRNRQKTIDRVKYVVDASDLAVDVERVVKANNVKSDGYLLTFRCYRKGNIGKSIFMPQSKYEEIAENYDPYNELKTWVTSFLNFINK